MRAHQLSMLLLLISTSDIVKLASIFNENLQTNQNLRDSKWDLNIPNTIRHSASWGSNNASVLEYGDMTSFAQNSSFIDAYTQESYKTSGTKYCTCGNSLLQTRFCRQDFVIAGFVSDLNRGSFHGGSFRNLPFSGLLVEVEVIHVMRGILRKGDTLKVHYVVGSTCGVSQSNIPKVIGNYIISGFTIPSTCGNLRKCPQTILIVTSCGWTEPLNELTPTRIAGLFLGLYSCTDNVCQNLRPEAQRRLHVSTERDSCSINVAHTHCYSRFSICYSKPANSSTAKNVCHFRAIKKLVPSQRLLSRLPSEVQKLVKVSFRTPITDEDRFSACVLHQR